MDLTNFINSKDIRDYHREIGYQYNALEAAWLVTQCHRKTLEQKHDAWNWIIDNMPDGLIRFFDDMWFEFPVPFKRGDIVTLAAEHAKSRPIVLESALVPPGENAEEYRKWRKENGGGTSDMYYRGELKGRQRVLKSISAWLKGELGDDPELMLIAYHRIMLEEALSQTVPCLYTNEGLQKVVLPERDRKAGGFR